MTEIFPAVLCMLVSNCSYGCVLFLWLYLVIYLCECSSNPLVYIIALRDRLFLPAAPLLPRTSSHIYSSGWANHRLSLCHTRTHTCIYMLTHAHQHICLPSIISFYSLPLVLWSSSSCIRLTV